MILIFENGYDIMRSVMETERNQKELFEFEAPRKTAARFNNIFQKTDFAVSLSPERIVFVSIGIIMLMVVFFALGVEKGKSIAARRPAIRTSAVVTAQPIVPQGAARIGAAGTIQAKLTPAPSNITPKNTTTQAQVAPIASITAKTPAASTALDKTKPYTVVAAAFSRQDFAAQEVNKLKSSGLEAFIYYAQPYYLACIGSYANKDSAQKILNRVRQVRKDAYVRLR